MSSVQPLKLEKVRVVTKQGMWFDLDKPDDFNMSAFAASIRGNGCLLTEKLFQPLSEIATIFVWSEDKPPKMDNVVTFNRPG